MRQNLQIQICTVSKTTNITHKIYMYPHETIPLKGQIQNVQIQICTLSKLSNINKKIYMYPHETIPLRNRLNYGRQGWRWNLENNWRKYKMYIFKFIGTQKLLSKLYVYPHETIPLKGPSEARAARMAVRALTDDEKSELREQFTNIDKDESGYVVILIHNKGTVTSFYFRSGRLLDKKKSKMPTYI